MSTLHAPNARVPWVNSDGTLTATAVRILQTLQQRAGGAIGDGGDDVVQPAAALDDTIALVIQPAISDQVSEIVTQPRYQADAWPIGSVFTSVISTNPALLLGYGTWTAFGSGQFLVGYAAGDPDFGTAGATGGVKSISIQDHAAHTHQVTSNVSVADHANHTHTFVATSNLAGGNLLTPSSSGVAAKGTTDGVSATLTHTVTNNTVASGNPSATLTHLDTVSGTTTSKTLPPFVVVYFWQRTA